MIFAATVEHMRFLVPFRPWGYRALTIGRGVPWRLLSYAAAPCSLDCEFCERTLRFSRGSVGKYSKHSSARTSVVPSRTLFFHVSRSRQRVRIFTPDPGSHTCTHRAYRISFNPVAPFKSIGRKNMVAAPMPSSPSLSFCSLFRLSTFFVFEHLSVFPFFRTMLLIMYFRYAHSYKYIFYFNHP